MVYTLSLLLPLYRHIYTCLYFTCHTLIGPVLDRYKKTFTTSNTNTANKHHRRRRDSDSSMIHSSYNNSNNSSDSNDEEDEEEDEEEMSNVPSVGFEQPSTVDTTTADSTDATSRCVYEYVLQYTCIIRVSCTCILHNMCMFAYTMHVYNALYVYT